MESQLAHLQHATTTILHCIGEDTSREGLLNTPARFAELLLDLTQGYRVGIDDVVNGEALIYEHHEGLVVVKDIEFFSLCEHHMLPFYGKVHIGYLPGRALLGLSKFSRIVQMFSQRLQVQERLTEQIAAALDEVLVPAGVAVVTESSHLCVAMRGVMQTQTTTIAKCFRGKLKDDFEARSEFLSSIAG